MFNIHILTGFNKLKIYDTRQCFQLSRARSGCLKIIIFIFENKMMTMRGLDDSNEI